VLSELKPFLEQVLSSGVVNIHWPWPFAWMWTSGCLGITTLLPSLPPSYLEGYMDRIPMATVVRWRYFLV
jgi:hypothetical protein